MVDNIPVFWVRVIFVVALCFGVVYILWGYIPSILKWLSGKYSRRLRFGIAVIIIIVLASTSPLYITKIINDPELVLERPSFIDTSQEVTISLGEGGIEVGCEWYRLKYEDYVPIDIEGLPLRLYIDNDKLYVDVIVNENFDTMIKLEHDNITIVPENWDRNYDSIAIEVVDDNGIPVFQMIRKDWFHIVLNGVFEFSGRKIYAGVTGMSFDVPVNYQIERIFKYPSEQHLHKRE